jgi:hypothetical protein
MLVMVLVLVMVMVMVIPDCMICYSWSPDLNLARIEDLRCW